MEQVLKKDIILVPMPFPDQSGIKLKPALVISSDNYNGSSSDVVACAITSNVGRWEHEVVIRPEDWKNGLYSESCVKADSVFSIEKRLAVKRIGKLGAEKFEEVMGKILWILGFKQEAGIAKRV